MPTATPSGKPEEELLPATPSGKPAEELLPLPLLAVPWPARSKGDGPPGTKGGGTGGTGAWATGGGGFSPAAESACLGDPPQPVSVGRYLPAEAKVSAGGCVRYLPAEANGAREACLVSAGRGKGAWRQPQARNTASVKTPSECRTVAAEVASTSASDGKSISLTPSNACELARH